MSGTTRATTLVLGSEGAAGGDEGFVAKDEASPYESDPPRRWLKVKQMGWTAEEDRRQRRRIFEKAT